MFYSSTTDNFDTMARIQANWKQRILRD